MLFCSPSNLGREEEVEVVKRLFIATAAAATAGFRSFFEYNNFALVEKEAPCRPSDFSLLFSQGCIWRNDGAWLAGWLAGLAYLFQYSESRLFELNSTLDPYNLMETLPVELLRLIYAYCDPPSVRSLREANRTLADVGYEYLLAPHLSVVTWRQDVERLLSIAQHDRLRGSITSICIYLGELSYHDAMRNSW